MKKKFSLLMCLSIMLSALIFPQKNISAKENDNHDFYSKFTQIIREYDYSFENITIEKNSLTPINETYMISDKMFTELTGDKISTDNNSYSIYNDECNIKLDIENNTFINNGKISASDENFVQKDDTLLIPIEDLAIELGYEITPSKDSYMLSRTFASKRLIIDSEKSFNLLDAVAYANHNDLHIIQFDNEKSAKDAFEYYSSLDTINAVAVDMAVEIAETPSDENDESSKYNSWGADYIGVDEYLSKIKASSLEEVVVAVIDTGADHDHDLLQGRLVEGGVNLSKEEDLDDEYPYEDGHKHGTHVSGIIADLTPSNVKILPIKSMKSNGKGEISSIIAGIQLCVDYKTDTENPMNIVAINMSLGGVSAIGSDVYNDYSTWINNALDNDILSIVAAGNETQDCIRVCPANVENAITVSALKEENNRLVFDASYSNYGSYVDISAPGTKILSGILNNETDRLSGTSMATPHVAAMVALLRSNTDTEFTCQQVQTSIFATAIDLGASGKDNLYGYGCINISQGYANVIEKVTFSNTSLYHHEPFQLTLNCSTPNSVIYYTLDGSTPNNETSELYTSPLTINQSCQISAIAYTFSSTGVINGVSPVSSQSFSFDGITPEAYFSITDDGIITGYIGTFTLVGIPDTIAGITPVGIADNVFAGCTIEEISLPDTIKTIGMMSFYNCSNLQTIIANGVTTIDRFAFYGDTSLTNISFNSLQIIEPYAFYLCSNLSVLNLPQVTTIKNSAFNMASFTSQLTSVNLPQVNSIGNDAFYSATNISNINIPNIELIGSLTFYNCNKITTINATNLKYIGNRAFYNCTSLTSINMPIIKTIGTNAFFNNINLTSVTISNYIELIGDLPFHNTSKNLKFNIYVGNDYLFNFLQENDFTFTLINSSTNFDYTLNNNEITITGYTFTDSEIIIPEYINDYPVTTITSRVFKNSNKIININSTTLKFIEDEAFYDCNNLQSLYIPNIESIGNKAFYNCPNLTTINIDNVKSLGDEAFVNTPKLTQVTFNTNINNIGNYAIGYNYDSEYIKNNQFIIFCKYLSGQSTPTELKTYANTNGIKLIEYNARKYNIYFQLKDSNITGTTAWITYIEDLAIGEISLPSQVKVDDKFYNISTIDDSAFENCSFITKVNLPSTIKTIGSYAFKDCISLKEINLENVESFGVFAFENCISLIKANLNATQTVSSHLFNNCTSLTTVNIPIVNAIGTSAFEDCYNLQTINFTPQHLHTIHSRAFYNNYKLQLSNLNNISTLGTLTSTFPTYYSGEVFTNCLALDTIYLNNIVNMGNSLFSGSGVKSVFIGKKLENISNAISDTNNITIYCYENTTAEYYAKNYKIQYSGQNNIPYELLNDFAITTNLPNEKIRIQQYNDLYLSINATGNHLQYYFYQTNSSHSNSTLLAQNEQTLQVDTSSIGTYYYYFIIKNWNDNTLTSNYTIIEVLESSQSYIVFAETDGNGTISPEGKQILAVGESKKFTILPNVNFRLYKLTINGEDKTSTVENNTFYIYNLYANKTINIYVEFEVDEFEVDIISIGNGKSSTSTTLFRGEDITLSFIANNNNHISSLILNNQKINEATGLREYTYVINNISEDFTFEIVYSIDTFTLSISKTGHGELSVSGNIIVEYGSNKVIEIFPNNGYKIESINLDGKTIDTVNYYTFTNINSNHSLHITFSERKYNIILKGNTSQGDIIINGTSDNLGYGESRKITITPKEGYLIDKVYVNNEEVTVVNNEIIVTNIDEDMQVDVKYKKDLDITITRPITDLTASPYGIYIITGIVIFVFIVLFISIICKKKRI